MEHLARYDFEDRVMRKSSSNPHRAISESEYWHNYELIRNEVFVSIESFYTYREIHNFAAESEKHYQMINKEASFWNINLYGLQAAFFVTLGRLFDSDDRSCTIDRLLSETKSHPEFFSKRAFESRRMIDGKRPGYLDSYLVDVWEPTAEDLETLESYLAPFKAQFDAIYKPIRNKVFAHRDFRSREQADDLFGKTKIEEIGKILYALHDVMEAIWQLYHNGNQPGLGKRTYDYTARIKATTRNVLADLGGPELRR